MIDTKAIYNIGYGLYVVTVNDGEKDNALIVNTVAQVANNPVKIAVTVSTENYSNEVIKKTKKLNVSCLTEKAPFSTFEKFGFHSGRDTDKFDGMNVMRSGNGLVKYVKDVNAVMSLEVTDIVELGSHTMFICSLTEAEVLSKDPSMTYAYYHKNVKPKPAKTNKKGWVCTICGYVHDEEELPPDFVCPICKHGAEDFEKIE